MIKKQLDVMQYKKRKGVTEPEANKVVEFLNDIQSQFPEKHAIVVQVRDLYLKNDPSLKENIKYGGLVFFDGKELIGGIFLYKKHISIEFSYGASLSDPYSALEGKGKFRRHIKVIESSDVQTKNIDHYVREAVAYRPQ